MKTAYGLCVVLAIMAAAIPVALIHADDPNYPTCQVCTADQPCTDANDSSCHQVNDLLTSDCEGNCVRTTSSSSYGLCHSAYPTDEGAVDSCTNGATACTSGTKEMTGCGAYVIDVLHAECNGGCNYTWQTVSGSGVTSCV